MLVYIYNHINLENKPLYRFFYTVPVYIFSLKDMGMDSFDASYQTAGNPLCFLFAINLCFFVYKILFLFFLNASSS